MLTLPPKNALLDGCARPVQPSGAQKQAEITLQFSETPGLTSRTMTVCARTVWTLRWLS